MSIRVYSVATELDGTTGKKLKAGRVTVTMVAYKNGRRIYKKTELPIVGTDAANLLANMVSAAEAVQALSEGKIAGISMEMGHYRYDEQLAELSGNSAGASVTCKTIDGKNMRVYVPFAKDMTRASFLSAVEALCATDETSTNAKLGYVKWNSDKTSLVTDQALIAYKVSQGESELTAIAPSPEFTDAPGIADLHVGDGA